ncbi:hypothetical protein BDC45DRAFT_575560 [Circinella umbellata]|nr:hypothetical protein BDC45DRAFT_575560 [Circinella umbellata]
MPLKLRSLNASITVKDWRSFKYNLNKAIENYGITGYFSVNVPPTKPTPERMQHEDVAANRIDVSGLHLKKYQQQQLEEADQILQQQ